MNGTFVLSTLLPAEKSFRPREAQQMARDHLWCIYCIAVVYVAAAQAGRRWMETRQRLNLQAALVAWNWSATAFNVACLSRILPDMLFVWRHYGFRSTICDDRIMVDLGAVNYWLALFGLAKGVEFLDTVFVVLRKKPLSPLHWLHHVLAFLFSFYLGSHNFGAARWYSVPILVVHCFLYAYLALKVMNVNLPQVFSKAILMSHVLQMAAGLIISLAALAFYWDNLPCPGNTLGMGLSSTVGYFTFMILYGKVYRRQYGSVSARTTREKTRSE